MTAAPGSIAELLLPPVSPAPAPAPTRLQVVDEEHATFMAAVDAAEAAVAAEDHTAALEALEESHVRMTVPSPLALRALFAASAAHLGLGDVDAAVSLLTRARAVTERPGFTDLDRADALHRLACCRLATSSVVNALSLLTHALDLCDRSLLPCDRLRVDILDRRSRCYGRQRDWAAARADVERALELAQGLGDEHVVAQLLFQASIVAERERQWLLARFYAEEALRASDRLGDVARTARVLGSLASLALALGDAVEAAEFAARARAAVDEADDPLASGSTLASLAQLALRTGDAAEAERDGRRAIDLLAGSSDFRPELGDAQLALAQALEALGRRADADAAFADAEATAARVGSPRRLAAVRIARGDALAGRGDVAEAAAVYRLSAEHLQDLRL